MRWQLRCATAATILVLLFAGGVAPQNQRGARRFPLSTPDENLREEDAPSHRHHSRDTTRRSDDIARREFHSRDAELVPQQLRDRSSGPTRSSFRSRNEVSPRDSLSRKEIPIVSSNAAEYERLQVPATRRSFSPRAQGSNPAEESKSQNDDGRTVSNESLSSRRTVSGRRDKNGDFARRGGLEERKTATAAPIDEPSSQRSFSRVPASGRNSLRGSSQTETANTVDTQARSQGNRGKSRAPEGNLEPATRTSPRLTETRGRSGGQRFNARTDESITETPETRNRDRTSSRGSSDVPRTSFRNRDSAKDEEQRSRASAYHSRTEGSSQRSKTLDRLRSRPAEGATAPAVTSPPQEETISPTEKQDVVEPLGKLPEFPTQESASSAAAEDVTTPVPDRGSRSTVNPLSRGPPRGGSNRGRGTARATTSNLKSEGSREKETDDVDEDDNYPEVYKQLKKSGTDPKDILALLKAKNAARETQQKDKRPTETSIVPDTSNLTPLEPRPTLGGRNFRKNLRGRNFAREPQHDEIGETQDISSGPKNGVRTGGPFRASPVFRSRSFAYNDDENSKEETEDNRIRPKFVPARDRSKILELPTEETKAPEVTTRKYERSYRGRSESEVKPTLESLNAKRRNNRKLFNKESGITVEPIADSIQQSPTSRFRPAGFRNSVQPRKLNLKPSTRLGSGRYVNQEETESKNQEEEASVNELDPESKEVEEQESVSEKFGNSQSRNRNKLEEKLELKAKVSPRTQVTEKSNQYVRDRTSDKQKFRARTEGQTEEATEATPIKPRYSLYQRQAEKTKLVTSSIEITTTPREKLKDKYKSYRSDKARPSFLPPRKVYSAVTTTPLPLSRYKERKESVRNQYARPGFPSKGKFFPTGLDEIEETENDDPLRHGFNSLSIDSLVSESEVATHTTEAQSGFSTTRRPRKYTQSHVYRIPPRKRPGSTDASTVTTPFYFPTTEFLASLAQLTAETTTQSSDDDDDDVTEDDVENYLFTEDVTETQRPTTVTTTTTTSTTTTTRKPTTKRANQKATSKPKPKKQAPRTTAKPTTTTTTTSTTTTKPTTTSPPDEETEEATEPEVDEELKVSPSTTTTTQKSTTTTTTQKSTTIKSTQKPTAKPKSINQTPKTTQKPKTTKAPTTTTTTPQTPEVATEEEVEAVILEKLLDSPSTTMTAPTTTPKLTTISVTQRTTAKSKKGKNTVKTTQKPKSTTTSTTTTTTAAPETTTEIVSPTTPTTTQKPTTKSTTKPTQKPKSKSKPKATTKKPTTTTTAASTTTKPTTTTTTTPTPTTTTATTSTTPTTTTPTTTTTTTPTPTTTTSATTTTPTTTTTTTTTTTPTTTPTTTASPSTAEIRTNSPVFITYGAGPSSTTFTPPTTPIPETTNSSPTTASATTNPTTETPRVVTILSTLAQLANNLTAQTTTPQYGNTAQIRTYNLDTTTAPPPQNATNFVVYGLLPNNDLVRKVVRTTEKPPDVPFIIYGLYPNGTIVRRYPNGTVVPEDDPADENEVIANIRPGDSRVLEEAVKKDNHLSYLYPPVPASSTTTAATTAATKTTHIQRINTPTTPMVENSVTTTETATPEPERKTTTTRKPSTTKSTTKKPAATKATTKKPPTTKKAQTTTKKPSTTKKPTTGVSEPLLRIMDTNTTSETTISTVGTSSTTPTTTTQSTTTTTTTTTTKKPTSKTTSRAKPKKKSTTKPTTRKPTTTSTTTTEASTSTTAAPSTTTVAPSSTTTKATTTRTTARPKTAKPKAPKPGETKKPKPRTTTTTTTTTTEAPTTTTVAPSSTTTTMAPTTRTTVRPKTAKPKGAKNKGTKKPKAKSTTTTTEAMSSISDIELLSNVLRNEKVVDAGTPITETEESLANKVIQLAIERANQVNAPQPSLRFGSTVPTEATTKNSTTESLIVTPESSTNKTGKISLWVIEDENTTPLPSKSSTVDVDNPDVDVINALLSTPGIDQLSLREQLILADVLSSTVAYPPVSTTKKKRPKVTTTTPAPQFPILRALFGRSRWAQGRGLFGQGLTGGYQSFREQNQNFGGVQNENVASGTTASPTTEFGDNQFGGAGANDLPPETRQGLVGAAINVSRAVSQFMSYVFQGATQSFQNYLQTRTRSLATSIANGPIS